MKTLLNTVDNWKCWGQNISNIILFPCGQPSSVELSFLFSSLIVQGFKHQDIFSRKQTRQEIMYCLNWEWLIQVILNFLTAVGQKIDARRIDRNSLRYSKKRLPATKTHKSTEQGGGGEGFDAQVCTFDTCYMYQSAMYVKMAFQLSSSNAITISTVITAFSVHVTS